MQKLSYPVFFLSMGLFVLITQCGGGMIKMSNPDALPEDVTTLSEDVTPEVAPTDATPLEADTPAID